jgi:hypothetical protein
VAPQIIREATDQQVDLAVDMFKLLARRLKGSL